MVGKGLALWPDVHIDDSTSPFSPTSPCMTDESVLSQSQTCTSSSSTRSPPRAQTTSTTACAATTTARTASTRGTTSRRRSDARWSSSDSARPTSLTHSQMRNWSSTLAPRYVVPYFHFGVAVNADFPGRRWVITMVQTPDAVLRIQGRWDGSQSTRKKIC